MAIKLVCGNNGTTYYFHNMKDCEAFKHVFKDHWCNVSWKSPEEIPDNKVPEKSRKYMNEDPKARANCDLGPMFGMLRDQGIRRTSEQDAALKRYAAGDFSD